MNKRDIYLSAIADRLSEAIEYYEGLDGTSETLNFAQSRTLEISRLFHANDLTKLQSLIHDFRGIDDCQYGSIFGLLVKIMADFIDSESACD